MDDGLDGGGKHYGMGGAKLSCSRIDGWSTDLHPPAPDTVPGPPPSGVGDTHHPASDDALNRLWPKFSEAVHARLTQGASDYGDESFSKPLRRLLQEVREELLDVSGWSFIMFAKLDAVEKRLDELEAR